MPECSLQQQQDEAYVRAAGMGQLAGGACNVCHAHAIHEPAKWVDKNFKRETAAEGADVVVVAAANGIEARWVG